MYISDKVKYVGVNDKEIDLFEGQYVVPNGMAYNSYVILDEKVAVFDTVDGRFHKEWLNNLNEALQGKKVDYLIVQHVEPDHSGSLLSFTKAYPNAVIVASMGAFTMIKNYFGLEFAENKIVVSDNMKLSLGESELTFFTAPMVHWPEVIMTYESKEKTLFSADAFGKFGALDVDEDWACEARRYYFGIVGKYGVQVQNLFKKIAGLEIKTICPLHGPILNENIGDYVSLYDTWSSYKSESEGVFIAYTSVYKNTEKAVLELEKILSEKGQKVVVSDLARCDMAEAVEDAFRYDKIIFATTTYNNGIFPFMREFIDTLVEHNFQNKKVGLIENGSWSPLAGKIMKEKLSNCKNLNFAPTIVKILSSLSESSREQLNNLANEILN